MGRGRGVEVLQKKNREKSVLTFIFLKTFALKTCNYSYQNDELFFPQNIRACFSEMYFLLRHAISDRSMN